MLARAFRDNPMNLAVLRRSAPARERANAAGMRALIPVARRHGFLLAATEAGAPRGVLVAAPAHGHPLPPPGLLAQLRVLVAQRPAAARRWREVFEALAALHPEAPHATLGLLGVAPDAQGRGVGTALLGRFLETHDAWGEGGVHLETDREANLAFYARAGFAVRGETAIHGVRVWCLWRPPRAFSPAG